MYLRKKVLAAHRKRLIRALLQCQIQSQMTGNHENDMRHYLPIARSEIVRGIKCSLDKALFVSTSKSVVTLTSPISRLNSRSSSPSRAHRVLAYCAVHYRTMMVVGLGAHRNFAKISGNQRA